MTLPAAISSDPEIRLDRSGLVDRVARSLARRVVCITAPWGSGKSSLLRNLAERLDRPLVRIRLDHRSGDASYFFWQLQRALGLGSERMEIDVETPLERVRQLAEVLADRPPLVVALDGAEVLRQSPAVIDLVGRLAQRLPPGVSLLIASRDRLDYPFAELAGRDEIVDFGPADVALSEGDVRHLFSAIAPGTEISRSELEALREALRGRILPLLLFGLAVRGDPDARPLARQVTAHADSPVSPILAALLETLEPTFVSWLERAAVLDELVPGVLDAVTGELGVAEERLAAASRLRLVEPTESPAVFPSSVRDELQRRLQRRPEEWSRANADAGRFLREREDPERALHHLVEAGEIEEAVEVMITVGHSIVTFNRIHAIERLLAKLPAEAFEANPVLRFTRGSIRIIRLQVEGAREDLRVAATLAEGAGLLDLANAARARLAYIAIFQADYETALREAAFVIDRTQGSWESVVVQAHTISLIAHAYLGNRADYERIERKLDAASIDFPEALNVLSAKGWVARLRGDWEGLETLGLRGVRAAQESRAPGGLCFMLTPVAEAALGLGRPEEALDIAEEAAAICRSMSETWWELVANSARLAALVELGRFEEARRLGHDLVTACREFGALHWTEAEAWIHLSRIPDEDRAAALAAADRAAAATTHRPLQSQVCLEQARLALEERNPAHAALQLSRAEKMLGTTDAPELRSEIRLLKVRLAVESGDARGAAAKLRAEGLPIGRVLARERGDLLPALVPLALEGDAAARSQVQSAGAQALPHLVRVRGRAAAELREQILDGEAGPLAVTSLGHFEVKRRATSREFGVAFRAPRVAALFRLLLISSDGLTRDALIDSLWPDDDPGAARRSLNTHLTYLRRSLEPHLPARTASRYLDRTEEGYRLTLRGGTWDADRFRGNAEAGLASEHAGDLHRADALLADALALYRGPLFAEQPYDELIAAPRERLATLFADASLAAARVARGLGNGQQARDRLEALLALDPSVEEAYALAMEIAGEAHRPADVRDLFERCRRAMQTQLDAEPSPETLALAKRLLAS